MLVEDDVLLLVVPLPTRVTSLMATWYVEPSEPFAMIVGEPSEMLTPVTVPSCVVFTVTALPLSSVTAVPSAFVFVVSVVHCRFCPIMELSWPTRTLVSMLLTSEFVFSSASETFVICSSAENCASCARYSLLSCGSSGSWYCICLTSSCRNASLPSEPPATEEDDDACCFA